MMAILSQSRVSSNSAECTWVRKVQRLPGATGAKFRQRWIALWSEKGAEKS